MRRISIGFIILFSFTALAQDYLPHTRKAFRAVATSPAGWSPTSISGCVAWFDVTNNTSQAEGSTLDWLDQSGNGYHATNSTTGSRPYLTNNFFGNNMAAMYSPGNRYLYFPETAMGCLRNVSGATFVGVVRFAAASNYGHVFFAGVNTSAANARFTAGTVGTSVQGGRARRLDADAGSNAVAAVALHVPHILSVVCDYVGGTIKVYTNGVAGATGTLATSGGNCSDTDSSRVMLFSGGTPAEFVTGGVGGIAIYNTALSDANRLLVEQWYTNRFGIYY